MPTKAERIGQCRSYSRERLSDPDYRRTVTLHALAGVDAWCEHYAHVPDLAPIIEAVREVYDQVLLSTNGKLSETAQHWVESLQRGRSPMDEDQRAELAEVLRLLMAQGRNGKAVVRW